MKSNLYKHIFFTSIIIALLASINGVAQQTDLRNYKIRFNFSTTKQTDNSRLLEVNFVARNKKNKKEVVPVYGAEIKFYNVLNNEEFELGTAITSQEGIALLTLQKNQKYDTDINGYIHLKARFNGTDAIRKKEKELIVKDLHLDLNLSEIDSIKTVTITAFTLDSIGNKTPVNNTDIIVYVHAMLSKMIINEGMINDGEFKFNMTQNFKGDIKRNLTISSVIDDNDDYGTIIQEKTVNWGTFNKQIKHDKNMLWTKAAPIWMYVVLTILLVGVWINYIYTIINLFKIKNEGISYEITDSKNDK